MKHKKQIYLNSLNSILMFLPFISIASSETLNEDITDIIDCDCISVSTYIEDNLSTFVSEYNLNYPEDEWKASYIEDKKTVTDIDSDEQYYYLDFDADNGYAIVGNEYNLIDFSTNGDLSYTKEVDSLLWRKYDGFIYKNDSQYLRYSANYMTEEELAQYSFNYNGKISNDYSTGSDCIINIPLYLVSRYKGGDEWYYSNEESNFLDGYQNVYQDDFAKGEGNCTLSAYYGIFQYLRDYKNLTELPRETITNDDGFEIPEIYSHILNCAKEYGYEKNSIPWTSINMASWGKNALKEMGYPSKRNKSYIHMFLTWSFDEQVVKNINAGYPIMWNQARGNYGCHSMIVKGYETYKRERKWWFIRWAEKKHFIVINDNWTKEYPSTYIDFDGYANDYLNEGFGTFVSIKDFMW